MIKLAEYVARFLARVGVRHAFVVSGGASLHLIHGIAATPGIEFICPQHEQAGAMAADAYARVTRNLGAAVATSGPGATNLITGICCAYYDSVPVLYITGNVATFRMKRDTGVRQVGFQETDVVAMVRTVTKYAVLVEDPKRIRYELEKAHHLAVEGRPGPVLIDIPDNVQRELIDPDTLEPFHTPPPPPDHAPPPDHTPPPDHARAAAGVGDDDIRRCLELLAAAQRPVIVAGWGVRLARAEDAMRRFIDAAGIPTVPTWAMADLLPHDHPCHAGTFGTHGTRHGNFTVQNADLILSIGSRLDTKATGSPPRTFARGAKKIMVDIDAAEIAKFQKYDLAIDLPIRADAAAFLNAILPRLASVPRPDTSPWNRRVARWKAQYPSCRAEYAAETTINPYVFVRQLSHASAPGDTLIIDTGCSIAWMMQAFEVKQGQRLIHDFNNTAMGYALPGAMAASLALGRRPVTCVTGDGSLQMNIQELATIVHLRLPVKIFLLNNHGHSMIQQTQDQWLGSQYLASSVQGGLPSPDFVAIARAYGLTTFNPATSRDADDAIRATLATPGPVFCNVEIDPRHRVLPQCRFGRPIEDAEPLLPRDEFLANMIVAPDPASR